MHGDEESPPTITVERSGERALITLRGDLDLVVEREITRTMASTVQLSDLVEVHVDATRVTFIDSSGLRSLLVARQAAIDHGLAFVLRIATPGPVARLVAMAGLDELLLG